MVRIPNKILWFGCGSQNLKLANLNARSRQRLSLSTNLGARGERGTQRGSEGGDDYGGIRGFLVRALRLLKLT
jgi:hypothetical protein